jgi:hypothetical protein
METYTVQVESFEPLDDEGLRLYTRLSDALRAFEIVALYNFRAIDRKKRLVNKIESVINEGYQVLARMRDLDFTDCAPLCPCKSGGIGRTGGCCWCRITFVSASETDPSPIRERAGSAAAKKPVSRAKKKVSLR